MLIFFKTLDVLKVNRRGQSRFHGGDLRISPKVFKSKESPAILFENMRNYIYIVNQNPFLIFFPFGMPRVLVGILVYHLFHTFRDGVYLGIGGTGANYKVIGNGVFQSLQLYDDNIRSLLLQHTVSNNLT